MNYDTFYVNSKSYLASELGCDDSLLNESSDLLRDGILDSLKLISFLHFIEKCRGSMIEDFPEINGSLTFKTAYEIYAG
jgi:hypothetical protein